MSGAGTQDLTLAAAAVDLSATPDSLRLAACGGDVTLGLTSVQAFAIARAIEDGQLALVRLDQARLAEAAAERAQAAAAEDRARAAAERAHARVLWRQSFALDCVAAALFLLPLLWRLA